MEPQQQTFLAARLEKSAGPVSGLPFTNSLGMKFVPLGDIYMSVWETRVQDYQAFCRATGRHYEPADFAQTATNPVVKVNWFDAVAFCKWLTDKERDENLIEDQQVYRLPTDLEESLRRFADDRAWLVARLRPLTAAQWQRTARHEEYNAYSIFIMFRHLALHDFDHAYRIEELVLRKDWPAR